MGAGLPQARINRAIRRAINQAFTDFGGERTEGRGEARTASGVWQGKAWTLSYRVSRASNGEVAIISTITVDGVPSNSWSLEKALTTG